MEQTSKNLSDYIDLASRRRYYIIIPFLIISIGSWIVAYNLPRTYRSTATMLMEAPIPKNVIQPAIGEYAEAKIGAIAQKVLTTEKVLAIIDSNHVYGNLSNIESKNELADLFKKNTDISLVESKLGGRAISTTADIAFTISFIHEDPITAKEVVSKLAALFIEQNDRERTQSAMRAADFLAGESEKLDSQIHNLDNKIAEYKKLYTGSLPEQVQGNLSALDRKENELSDTEQQIRLTKDRIAFLGAELARSQRELPTHTGDKATLSKAEQLRMLQRKYLDLSSKYYPSHPDVVRVKRQIEALDPFFLGQSSEEGLRSQLAEAKRKLKLLETRYDGNHPDIVRLKDQISKLEQRQQSLQPSQEEESSERVDNPVFLSIETQYKSSQGELAALNQKKEALISAIDSLQNSITLAPDVEKRYLELVRERDSTLNKFNQIKEKLLDAKLVQTLEEEQHGQTLTIIDQPTIPTHPEKKTKTKVALGGFFLGIAAGLGSAFLVEVLDPGIRGYRSLRAVTGLMPLVVIPYVETPTEVEKRLIWRLNRRKVIIWTAVVCIMLGIIIVGFYFLPFG